jgi:hypothetical protein
VSAVEILERLTRRGVETRVEGGRLLVRGLLTPRLRDELEDYEPALVELLGDRARVACPDYEPIAGTRRCRSYHPSGVCERPEGFMCLAWLVANGHRPPPP